MSRQSVKILVILGILAAFYICLGKTGVVYADKEQHKNIKILTPSDEVYVPLGKLTIIGTSSDNATTDCSVLVRWNDLSSQNKAVPTGLGIDNDYSTWMFTFNNNYHSITKGPNKMTAELRCNSQLLFLEGSDSITVIGDPSPNQNLHGRTVKTSDPKASTSQKFQTGGSRANDTSNTNQPFILVMPTMYNNNTRVNTDSDGETAIETRAHGTRTHEAQVHVGKHNSTRTSVLKATLAEANTASSESKLKTLVTQEINNKTSGIKDKIASPARFAISNYTHNSTLNLKVNNYTYPVKYQITSGSKVKSISAKENSSVLFIDLSSTSPGKLRIELPRYIIDSKNLKSVDDKYVVFVDGQTTVALDEVKNNNKTRTLDIPFDKGSEAIEIEGTHIVPEFVLGTSSKPLNSQTIIIVLILAAAITGIIIAGNRCNDSNNGSNPKHGFNLSISK
jgi:hypothetical protein